MAIKLKDKNGNPLMLDDDAVEMESGKSLQSAVDDGDIIPEGITEETSLSDTEEIIICEDGKEDEPVLVINKDGIKVKSITDIDGNPISGSGSSELKNKIYVQAGDSISEGAGLVRDEDKVAKDDSCYPISGVARMTYGYFIAKYNSMKWINQGLSGSTFGDVSATGEDKSGYSKENGRYTKIPDDVDYISIWFGWNDAAYGPIMKRDEWLSSTYGQSIYAPYAGASVDTSLLGTTHTDGTPYATSEQWEACKAATGSVGGVAYSSSSEYFKALYRGTSADTTNKTWWGAFNVVLPYLIAKYPLAKILVIVGYGGDSDMWDVGIEAAKKYGLSYIDLSEAGEMNFISARNTSDASGKVYYDATLYTDRNLYKGYSSGEITASQFRYRTLLYDGCHPNQLGYKYLYPKIREKLLK